MRSSVHPSLDAAREGAFATLNQLLTGEGAQAVPEWEEGCRSHYPNHAPGGRTLRLIFDNNFLILSQELYPVWYAGVCLC